MTADCYRCECPSCEAVPVPVCARHGEVWERCEGRLVPVFTLPYHLPSDDGIRL